MRIHYVMQMGSHKRISVAMRGLIIGLWLLGLLVVTHPSTPVKASQFTEKGVNLGEPLTHDPDRGINCQFNLDDATLQRVYDTNSQWVRLNLIAAAPALPDYPRLECGQDEWYKSLI